MTTQNAAAVAEFERAVVCAFQYASASLDDAQAQQLKQEAETFCAGIKASPEGWRLCVALFQVSEHDFVKFYALQALQEALSKPANDVAMAMAMSMAVQIRRDLLAWLQANVAYVESHAAFLKTKLAVVITLLIKREYPDQWPTAFDELMSLLPMGASMVEMYFRVLVAINEEIVEFDAKRTAAEVDANMRIKDAMRESSCMANTFDAIFNVLSNCDASAVMCELSYSALETLKRYIPWVDIGLIANDRFVPLLFRLVRESAALRCPATNCIFEIIDKGMNAQKKLALLVDLHLLEVLPTLPIQDDDEFAEEVAEVVNAIGLELIQCMDEFRHEENAELFSQASNMLVQAMPLVWALFDHETKDVSEEVFEVVNAVGTLIRAETNPSPVGALEEIFTPSAYIPQILHGIYRQTRYPEDSDSDVAEFEEYRRSLYKIYVNITRQRPLDTLSFLTSLTHELPSQFSQIEPRDLEAYISLVYRFKEGIAAMKSMNALEDSNTPLSAIVIGIHTNILAAAAVPTLSLHPSVLLTYYDMSVRYCRVLQHEAQLIPAVLDMMFGPNGLGHLDAQLRSRTCYQCLQLVRSIGAAVHPHVMNLLQALGPHLTVPKDDEAIAQKQNPTFIPFDDQLYLYALAGQVVVSLPATPEMMTLKLQYIQMILNPLEQALNVTIGEVAEGKWPELQAGEYCSKVLSAIAHVLKAFKGTACFANQQEIFTAVLVTTANTLRVFPHHESVRAKVIFMLHRLVTVVEKELFLQHVAETIELLSLQCEAANVVEIVQLLDQLMIRFKNALAPFFEHMVMPFIQHLCSFMPPRNASADTETKDASQLERESLQKYLEMFILHLAVHKLSIVLLRPTNVGQLENVLQVVLEGCADVTDAQVNRSSFSIAHELVSQWLLAPNPPVELTAEGRTRFAQIMLEQFTPAMFLITKKHHFETSDVQCAAVIKEIATLQQVILQTGGDEYLVFLRDSCLQSLGCPSDWAMVYAAQVATGDRKAIASAFTQLVDQMQQSQRAT